MEKLFSRFNPCGQGSLRHKFQWEKQVKKEGDTTCFRFSVVCWYLFRTEEVAVHHYFNALVMKDSLVDITLYEQQFRRWVSVMNQLAPPSTFKRPEDFKFAQRVTAKHEDFIVTKAGDWALKYSGDVRLTLKDSAGVNEILFCDSAIWDPAVYKLYIPAQLKIKTIAGKKNISEVFGDSAEFRVKENNSTIWNMRGNYYVNDSIGIN